MVAWWGEAIFLNNVCYTPHWEYFKFGISDKDMIMALEMSELGWPTVASWLPMREGVPQAPPKFTGCWVSLKSHCTLESIDSMVNIL